MQVNFCLKTNLHITSTSLSATDFVFWFLIPLVLALHLLLHHFYDYDYDDDYYQDYQH